MFTIKVIEEDGSEFVRPEVAGVRFNPAMTETDNARLFVWYKDQSSETYYLGKVYVMNESGKTIADYLLLPPAVKKEN